MQITYLRQQQQRLDILNPRITQDIIRSQNPINHTPNPSKNLFWKLPSCRSQPTDRVKH